jgi:hypothetical protein
MSKHTPGPWTFTKGETLDEWRLLAADGESLMGSEQYYPWVPHREADWLLIAAAPELYEALRAIVGVETAYGASHSAFLEALRYARAALAKVDA